jgi:hypothetical protein
VARNSALARLRPRPRHRVRSPQRKTCFRPNRSPKAPATNVRAASGKSSAFINHCRLSEESCMLRLIGASATVTTALPAKTRQPPKLDAPSTLILLLGPTTSGSESAWPHSLSAWDAPLTIKCPKMHLRVAEDES